MSVFFILRTAYFNLTSLATACATADLYFIASSSLRRCYSSHVQPAKAKLALHAKQVLSPADQAVAQRQAYVADFELLNDVLLKTGVFYFQAVLKIEGIVVVEIGGYGHFLADLTYNV